MSVEAGVVPSLFDLSFAETGSRLERDGVRAVHAAALWKVLYADADRAGLPAPLQRWLAAHETEVQRTPAVAERTASADGRTEKFLLRMDDGQEVETVIMGYPGRFTACLSTQAGCAMGCVFCATGQMGFVRHLLPGEIVSQVRHIRRVLADHGERLRNVVLMGMGEPLHNYEHVMKALAIVTDARGVGLGPSRVTVNTVGVVPAILRMADEGQPYHLGVSLHGSTEDERARLVPVSVRWPLADLIDACRTYSARTRRRVFFAWTLIAGVNDSRLHATRLATLLRGMDAHVNLIRLNPTAGFVGVDAPDTAANTFRATVQAAGLPCTIRQLRGIDVAAGCGQLKADRARRAGAMRSAPASGDAVAD